MHKLLEDLIAVMTLERLEDNLFRGQSRDVGSPQVFGGQVLGQALVAASATIEARAVHSLHAYFLRRGDVNAPIVYEVDRAWDGKHFSTRRVVAIQHGEQIFNMSASFQFPETGLSHQASMPQVPSPDEVANESDLYRENLLKTAPPAVRRMLEKQWPFEFRAVRPFNFLDPVKSEPVSYLWIRAVDRLPDDEALHRCLLAYVSDYPLLDTALRPHGVSPATTRMAVASIDHAMWFHRSVRVDDWLLYAMESTSASGARGFSRGSIFTREGVLVASAAQEGLIRVIEP
jgi:acyl-CoA thioesterase II